VGEQRQQAHIFRMAGLHLAAGEHGGLAEEISLKVIEVLFDRRRKLRFVLYSFRHQRSPAAVKPGQYLLAGLLVGGAKIHLDVIGELDKRS